MPEQTPRPKESSDRLSDQISAYRAEAIDLISNGIEHIRFEVKRSCSILKENKDERAAFVKVIQGLANAHLDDERFFLVGADNREKRFYSLDDVHQYDQARVGDLLKSALEPIPEFAIFPLEAENGDKFVLVVIGSQQRRPIVCKSDMTDSKGKTVLRRGDIWIKENTSLRLANRDDLEQMVKIRIDLESESRAKSRFSEFLAASDHGHALFQRSSVSLPQKDLIFGSEGGFRLFVEELIATGDGPRFQMLLELFRDELIEGWHALGASRIAAAPTGLALRSSEYIKNSFMPALHRLAQLSLLICKFSASFEWFGKAVDLIAQTHTTITDLEGLFFADQNLHRRTRVLVARAARIAAAYALKRQRYAFLRPCLTKYSPTRKNSFLQPLLFDWRAGDSTVDPAKVGLGGEVWDEMGSWISVFFGSVEDVNNAIAKLEFVLEFNSFLVLGANDVAAPAKEWFAQAGKGKDLTYISAIWRLPLSATEPVALLLTTGLKNKDMEILKNLAVEPEAFQYVLTKFANDPLEVERTYLRYLENEQHDFFMRSRRFPPDFDWSDQLKEAAGMKAV